MYNQSFIRCKELKEEKKINKSTNNNNDNEGCDISIVIATHTSPTVGEGRCQSEENDTNNERIDNNK